MKEKEKLSTLNHKHIGKIFVDMGFIITSQPNEVLEDLSKKNICAK